jgi:hypothetical protein
LSTGASDHARAAFLLLPECITPETKKAQILRLAGAGFTKVSNSGVWAAAQIVVAVALISD